MTRASELLVFNVHPLKKLGGLLPDAPALGIHAAVGPNLASSASGVPQPNIDHQGSSATSSGPERPAASAP